MIDKLNITEQEKKQVNEWVSFFSFKPTWAFKQLINCHEKMIGLFTGNQSMKTASMAMYNVMSILGILPVEHKNIRPTDPIRIIRFASEKLPGESGETGNREVKNTQYPEFKKWLPRSLIKKDITIRNPVMTLKDPQGGDDILVEFVSFNQDIQAQAGVQRRRVWIDEHSHRAFYEEQLPRLLAANGDLFVTLTPAQEYLDWEYDEFFERASRIIRTPTIVQSYKEEGVDFPLIENTGIDSDIAIIMAATDDNPTLDKETIDKMFELIGDPDVIAIRRYGKFKQISGKIFKMFDKRVHIISKDKYFPNGLPHDWLHARGIDFHEQNPWAIGWIALSPDDEAFIYNEFYPSPESMVTSEISKRIAIMSGTYKYNISLVDPLAAKKQANTGYSVQDDLSSYMYDLKQEGMGTGGFWQSWDTKSQIGRDAIRSRLANAKLCRIPFNNKINKNGREYRLPTLWVLNNCKLSAEFMYQWRKDEWASREASLTKDSKDKPQQKWSHFNMVWEGIFKHQGFNVSYFRNRMVSQRKQPYHDYMRG